MMHGPRLILCENAKCGSRTLKARLAPELTDRMPGGTHVGLWAAEILPKDRIRVVSIREPVSWHVSHFTHWLTAWRAGFDRAIEWMRPTVANMARHLLDIHETPPTHPDVIATLWAAYVGGATDPRWTAKPLRGSPEVMAWQVPPGDMPVRLWMARNGVGLYTWAYVRAVLPREDWLTPVPSLIRAAQERPLYSAALDCAQLDKGIPELAARYDLEVVDAPRIGKPRSAPRIIPTARQIQRIRAYERLSYHVHGWGEDMPAIVWGDRA